MQLILKFRNVLPNLIVQELDNIVATVRAFFGVQHKEDGTHGNLTADSITVSGPIYAGVPPVDLTTTPVAKLPNLGPTYVTDPTITAASAGEDYPSLRVGPTSGVRSRLMNLVSRDTLLSNNLTFVGGAWTGDNAAWYGEALGMEGDTGLIRFYNSPPGANPRSPVSVATINPAGAITERGRSTPLGEWINVPYSAANFSANTGTWTVEAADLQAFRYTLIGKTMSVAFRIAATSLSSAATWLTIRIPGGFTAAAGPLYMTMGARVSDASGHAVGVTYVSGVEINIEKIPAGFASGTNTLSVIGMVTFEVA